MLAFAVAATSLVFAPPPAFAQRTADCEATFVVYNAQQELNRLWIELDNRASFFDGAELLGYRARRGPRFEWRCTPFDEPCPGDDDPPQMADYRYSEGVGHLLTGVTPGAVDPLLQISVERPLTTAGAFDVRVTKAIDATGADVVPAPLVCFESVVCTEPALDVMRKLPFACGDPTGDGQVTVSDALAALFDVTEQPERGCNGVLHLCDTDDSGTITLTDALRLLQIASGLNHPLLCPLPPSCRR